MIGAIAGDIAGSCHEQANLKRMNFQLYSKNSRFTDDTVMTVAVMDCLLTHRSYNESFRDWGRRYPDRGYGGMFRKWLVDDEMGPYNSFGNGSAMRVSPIGFAFHRLKDVLAEAERSALPSHNHPEGIKGAQAVAAAVFLARKGKDKSAIRDYIESEFGYRLRGSIAKIRKHYSMDVTCQGSVPQAIIAFLESDDVEHAIRLAISLGGDADTQACMAGGIAQAYFKTIPPLLVQEVEQRLSPEMWALVQTFYQRYNIPS